VPESASLPTPNKDFALAVDQLQVGERAVVIGLRGDLDLWSSARLKSTLCDLLTAGQDRLVLDLTHVGFMDSTALGVLIGVQRRLGKEARLAVAAQTQPVLRVLELSGLATGLSVFSTREAALSYVTEEDALPPPRARPPLTADAALMIGIASTAMPFAQSAEDQAERWLRALRNHGEAGAILASLGLSETPLDDLEHENDGDPPGRGDPDAVATVTREANRTAVERGARKLETVDVLVAVTEVYGPTFYRVLAAHGVDPAELRARLAGGDPVAGEPVADPAGEPVAAES
jgi:anti-sigma B factor antagonist